MAKKKDQHDDGMVAVEEALSKTERFIEKHQKILIGVISVIVIVVLGFYGFKKLYVAPMEKEAQEQMFVAEKYFEVDSLQRALYGDGNNLGFLDIIDEYGITVSGNLAQYYAGICFLKMGQYEDAIDYLSDFKKKDQIVGPMAFGAIGDAYMELEEKKDALYYYERAAKFNVNDFTTPLFLLKAGWTAELMEDYEKAYDLYEKIEKEYPRSNEARDIEKYLARIKTLQEYK
ncbi:MAG: tetratricopeptide repeat protein [Bacteroidales bacterium]